MIEEVLSIEQIGSKQAQALYAFAGWLTTRDEEVSLGATNDCAPIAELVSKFCDSQGWKITEEQWIHNFKPYPSESTTPA